jgi:hypothetical protein
MIRDGETVTLVLRHHGDDGRRTAPDLSPLRQDFDVLGSHQSQRTTVVNGTLDRSVDWIVSLAPHATGSRTPRPLPEGSYGIAGTGDGDPRHARPPPSLPRRRYRRRIQTTVAPLTTTTTAASS